MDEIPINGDHFSQKCFSKNAKRGQAHPKHVKNEEGRPASKKPKVEDENVQLVDQYRAVADGLDDSDDVFCVTTAGTDNEVICHIGGVQVKAIIDSGSTCNKEKESDRAFKAYGGHNLTVLGKFDAVLQVKNNSIIAQFYVIKGPGKLLIGRKSAKELGVLKINTDVNKIDDKVQEFAKIKGVMVEIPIKANVKPVVQPYRRVPIPLEKAVDDQIEMLLKQGIIEILMRFASAWTRGVQMRRSSARIIRCPHSKTSCHTWQNPNSIRKSTSKMHFTR